MNTPRIGILTIDQGTTSSRAIVFLKDGTNIASAQQEFTQYYPNNGWVEHDPEEIWNSTLAVTLEVIRQAAEKGISIACMGITNQNSISKALNNPYQLKCSNLVTDIHLLQGLIE